MKTWFPFSDYDFYSFLASGILLLFAIDYWMSGGEWAIYKNWTLQQNILVLILAYITGQIITIPSSILYDTILINKVLGHPIEVQLFKGNLSYIKRFVGCQRKVQMSPLLQCSNVVLLDKAKNRGGPQSLPLLKTMTTLTRRRRG